MASKQYCLTWDLGVSKQFMVPWRKLKLDWRYAIGELIIIVAGVLVALAIDQWNDERHYHATW